MDTNEKKYEELIHEKANVNMKYLAQRIVEIRAEDDEEFINKFDNDQLPEMPKELKDQIFSAVEKFDMQAKEDARKKRRRNRIKVLSRCAVFLLCVGVVGALVLSQASAWKLRFLELFTTQDDDHVDIRPYDSEELENWHDYYIFDEVPEGYELTYAEDDGHDKIIIYENGENQILLDISSASKSVTVDNELTNQREIQVNGKDALLYDNKKDKMKIIILLESDKIIEIYSSGPEYLSDKTMIEMAENLQYIP